MKSLPLMRPALAVNTMSGELGCGNTRRTVARSVSVSWSERHCCFATALSILRRLPCIHGLMMYATLKYSGGHMRKTRGLRAIALAPCSDSDGECADGGSGHSF